MIKNNMITINTQEELEALIDNNNNIIIDDDLNINCNIEIEANIKAWDIEATDIKAWDIEAKNIEAKNIEAKNIKAWDITYYAVCFAYNSIICKSIKGRRNKSKHFALDGTITETNNNL